MAVKPVPSLTAIPPFPALSDRAAGTYNSKAYDFGTHMATKFNSEFLALAGNVRDNATDAAASATTANTRASAAGDSASAAGASAGAAADSASAASTSAGLAGQRANAAADSAAAAANSAAGLVATSTSASTLTTGSKSFTVQAGKQFSVGAPVRATNPANAAQFLDGTVTSYSGTALVINVTAVGGTGTVANWSISITGAEGRQGPMGDLSGGNLTGALNESKGAVVASAASPNIWSAGGNLVPISGTATITGFPAAPQAGTRRRLLAQAAFSMTSGANLVIKGGSFTAAAGDEIEVVAETTTLFRVTRFAGASTRLRMVVLTSGAAWTVAAQDFTVECQAGGSGGSAGNAGGRAGGYVKKAISGATVGVTATISVGNGGTGGFGSTAAGIGGNTTFALSGFTTVTASATGTSSGGDLVIEGQAGMPTTLSNFETAAGGNGGNSALGFGGIGGNFSGGAPTGYGAGGAGGGFANGVAQAGSSGQPGVIIITYLG